MLVRRVVAAGALVGLTVLTACTSGSAGTEPSRTPAPQSEASSRSVATSSPASSSASGSSTAARRTVTARPAPRSSATPRPQPTTSAPPSRPASRTTSVGHLPLRYSPGSADQVITVVASSQSSTQGTLQTWSRTSDGWRRVGAAVHAWLGSDGMSTHPSEQLSAVPMGSYSLTRAFGHDSDPGTALPYTHTTPADWWISQPGPLYNTMQRCSSQCSFTRGDPNEHLYYETPFYNYAVVIDYNAHPVRPGAGSAFFLHVTVGRPTQGCVSIVQSQLVRILRWLRPSEHPRILIGTA